MGNSLFESEYIFGIHEPGGEQYMLEAGKPGWILFTEGIGHDPNNQSGADYSAYSDRGLGVISRLNNGYNPNGTIPHSRFYGEFAQRCANFVAASQGCHIWIIGNEMNYAIERPPSSPLVLGALESDGSAPILDGFLRAVSGGMGTAELGSDLEAINREVEDDISQPDPFWRSHPDRFAALRQKQDFLESIDLQPAQQAPDPLHRLGGEVITPALYVNCYTACRDAIHNVPGHEQDLVLIGSVAPWNNQTVYLENPAGDWILYFRHILELLGPDQCDGISLHTYTHGADPNLIYDDSKMDPPFDNYHYHFKTYQDFMMEIPHAMRHLPVYITETDEDVPWQDENNGWVQNAYAEIHHWNQQPENQQVRALILYRWPRIDKWAIDGKAGVIDDFRGALENEYRWESKERHKGRRQRPKRPPIPEPVEPAITLPPPAPFRTGMVVAPTTLTNLRQTAGYLNKEESDKLLQLPTKSRVQIVNETPAHIDHLIWWQVQTLDLQGALLRGWLAQFDPEGVPLLEPLQNVQIDLMQPVYDRPIHTGIQVQTVTDVYVRLTPGNQNKPEDDVLTALPKGFDLTVTQGPADVDGLLWWQVYDTYKSNHFLGWVADSLPATDEEPIQLLLQPIEPINSVSSSQASPLLLRVPAAQAKGLSPAMLLPIPSTLEVGDIVYTTQVTRLYGSIGSTTSLADGSIHYLWPGAQVQLIDGPNTLQEQQWWQIETRLNDDQPFQGWILEKALTGESHFTKLDFLSPLPDGQHRPFSQPTSTSPHGVDDPALAAGLEQKSEIAWRSGLEVIATREIVLYRTAITFRDQSRDEILPRVVGALAPDLPARVLMKPRKVDGLEWLCIKGENGDGETVHGWTPLVDEDGDPHFELASKHETEPLEKITVPSVDKPQDKPQPLGVGDTIVTVAHVRMRQTPGYLNKPQDNFITELPAQHTAKIVDGPQEGDGLRWWQIETQSFSGKPLLGWVAASTPDGEALIRLVGSDADESGVDGKTGQQKSKMMLKEERLSREETTPSPELVEGETSAATSLTDVEIMAYDPGQLLVCIAPVRVRRSAGYQEKPPNDTLGEFLPATTVNVIDGPVDADDLTWYQVGGIAGSGYSGAAVGWAATQGADGTPYLSITNRLPNRDIPNTTLDQWGYLGQPFSGRFGISQLWGENANFYRRFKYDNVPLRGHNGIDFLTPTGTPILAVDAGMILRAGFDPGGFGNFVLMSHIWGQSVYAHLHVLEIVAGKAVGRGTQLGLAGNTGNSTGPHLHFAIRVNPHQRVDGWGGFSDPLPYMYPDDIILPRYVLPGTRGLADPDGAVRVVEQMEPSGLNRESEEYRRP